LRAHDRGGRLQTRIVCESRGDDFVVRTAKHLLQSGERAEIPADALVLVQRRKELRDVAQFLRGDSNGMALVGACAVEPCREALQRAMAP